MNIMRNNREVPVRWPFFWLMNTVRWTSIIGFDNYRLDSINHLYVRAHVFGGWGR